MVKFCLSGHALVIMAKNLHFKFLRNARRLFLNFLLLELLNLLQKESEALTALGIFRLDFLHALFQLITWPDRGRR